MNKLSLYELVKTVVATKNESPEALTEGEIEAKFAALALAFRTDKLTLDQRLELQKRQRDVAERDAINELQILKDSIRQLSQLIVTSEQDLASRVSSDVKDILQKIETHIDVIEKTNSRISSRSELFGAVRQEEKFSAAFDVILIHAENLKRFRDKEHRELEEAKKLITNYGNKKNEFDSDSENETHPRRAIRSISTSYAPQINLIRVRRASVSAIEVSRSTDMARRTAQNGNMNLRYIASNALNANRSRRRSMPTSPTLYRGKFITDNIDTSTHLEMTAEEKGDSEAECVSSVDNQDSDDEVLSNSVTPLHRKLSDDQIVCNKSNLVSNESTLITTVDNSDELDAKTFDQCSSDSDEVSLDNVERVDAVHFTPVENIWHFNDFHIRDYLNNHHLGHIFNYCFNGGLNNYFKNIIISINCQQLRLILAIILLILAVFIVILSFMPTNLPPYSSWEEIIYRIFLPYVSKEKVSKTQ